MDEEADEASSGPALKRRRVDPPSAGAGAGSGSGSAPARPVAQAPSAAFVTPGPAPSGGVTGAQFTLLLTYVKGFTTTHEAILKEIASISRILKASKAPSVASAMARTQLDAELNNLDPAEIAAIAKNAGAYAQQLGAQIESLEGKERKEEKVLCVLASFQAILVG